MIGACDICNAQKVEIAHGFVSGIETFHCAEGCPSSFCSDCGATLPTHKPGCHDGPTPCTCGVYCRDLGPSGGCRYLHAVRNA